MDANQRAKQWQNNNPKRSKENKRRSYLKHRARILEKQKQDRKANPEKYQNFELKKKYGITLETKQHMLANQGGRCANPGCRTTDPGGKYGEWQVDHDHLTNKVRGLLCASCNLTLGNAKDDVFRLEGLAQYLRMQK